MNRLMEKTVFSGFVTAWRFATCPTSRSLVLVNATTDGVRRLPSGLVMTTGSPPSITATTELVVLKSIPMILLMDSSQDDQRADGGPAPRNREIGLRRRIVDPDISIKVECVTVNTRARSNLRCF